jgi:hypothetical protein
LYSLWDLPVVLIPVVAYAARLKHASHLPRPRDAIALPQNPAPGTHVIPVPA